MNKWELTAKQKAGPGNDPAHSKKKTRPKAVMKAAERAHKKHMRRWWRSEEGRRLRALKALCEAESALWR